MRRGRSPSAAAGEEERGAADGSGDGMGWKVSCAPDRVVKCAHDRGAGRPGRVRAVVQRVERATVAVDGAVVGAIGRGLCVLVGVTHTDTAADARRLAAKLWRLRLFPDGDGRMDLGADEVGAEVLVISQFTLYGDTRQGRRPSWTAAAPGPEAEPLVDEVAAELGRLGARVATGTFGADMAVELVNDGPVTLVLEVPDPPAARP